MSMTTLLPLGLPASPSLKPYRRRRSTSALAWRVSSLRNTYVRLSILRRKLLMLPLSTLSHSSIRSNQLFSLWTLLEVQKLHRLLLAMSSPLLPTPVLRYGRHSGVHTALVISLIQSLVSHKGITLLSSELKGMGLRSLYSNLCVVQWLSEVYSYPSNQSKPPKTNLSLSAVFNHSSLPAILFPPSRSHN